MKKRWLKLALALALCLCIMLALASCDVVTALLGSKDDPAHCLHRDADDNGKCDTCGVDFTDGDEGKPDDKPKDELESCSHVEGAPVRENEVAATCTVDGSYDEVIYCFVSGCGAELSRVGKTVPAIGAHTPATAVRENEVAAT